MQVRALLCAVTVLLSTMVSAAVEGDINALYQRHCASCHGVQRYGGYAPPLIPETLKRRSRVNLQQVIHDGLEQTQMPAFGGVLEGDQIASLAAHIGTPVERIRWTKDDILNSRITFPNVALTPQPAVKRDEIVLVVERGTGSIVVLDGHNLQRLDTFPVGRIHGGPKFTRDHSVVFAATRDGTLVKYDLRQRRLVAKVKVAVNTRNIAISSDGAWVAVANQLPQNLVILDGALRPVCIFALSGKPSAVYRMPQADGFLLSLRDVPQLIYVDVPSLTRRHEVLPLPFEDFAFVPGRNQILASSRGGKQILLYDVQTNRIVRRLQTNGLPHLFSSTFFLRQEKLYAAINHIGIPRLSIIDMATFTVEKQFDLAGAGYFARTHPGSPFLWVDTNTDRIQLFDKATLMPIDNDLIPEPGKKAMHIAFTADGRRAMVSIWHKEGAVVVYDSASLTEIERYPFNMPVGKYTARNKTHFPLR